MMHKLSISVWEELFNDTQKCAETFKNGILGAQIASSPKAIAAIYGMRKKSVGLLGNAAGRRKFVAFTERYRSAT